MRAARRCETRSACMIFACPAHTTSERMKREEMDAVRRALPVPQRVMAVVLSALFVLCPLAAYAAVEEADAVPLPIIMYHEVKPDKSGKDAIQPWELESDLRWLAENGYTTVVMADVIAYVRDGTPLPEKPIVLCPARKGCLPPAIAPDTAGIGLMLVASVVSMIPTWETLLAVRPFLIERILHRQH